MLVNPGGVAAPLGINPPWFALLLLILTWLALGGVCIHRALGVASVCTATGKHMHMHPDKPHHLARVILGGPPSWFLEDLGKI